MSCRVIRSHTRILSQTAMLALMLGAAGCSSDFHRFDQSFYDNAVPTSSEAAAINPYPGDVDMQTTASIGTSNFAPAVGVGEVQQVIYTTPQAPNSGRQTLAQMDTGYQQASRSTGYVASGGQPETLQSYGQSYGNAVNQAQGTYGNTVSQAQGTYQNATSQYNNAKQTYNTYKTVNSAIGGTDSITTGSISKVKQTASMVGQSVKYNYNEETDQVNPAKPIIEKATNGQPSQQTASASSRRSAGWSAIGGTRIQVSEGETLYNLSKRFGVPVDALMEVNKISDPSTVRSGQAIIIPTYVYNKSNPTSAPDANPKTRASRSSTGFQGEASAGNVPVPDKRPQAYAAAKQAKSEEGGRPWTVEMADAGTKDGQIDPTTTGAITPSSQSAVRTAKSASSKTIATGKYQVQPGDTLYGISRKVGVSIGALTAANGIENNVVRLGQWLVVPDGSAPVKAQSAAKPSQSASAKTDQAKTVKSVEEPQKTAKAEQESSKAPKPYVKPEVETIDDTVTSAIDGKAPQLTGFGNLRRPVHGRVISQFGETRGGVKNDGVDISVPEGTPVKSVENGVVIYASNELSQFGNLVLIRHKDGFVSAYANLKEYDVQKGATVRRGEIIGRSGRTGHVNQPQLHFELRKNSNPVNPLDYFDAG